MISVETKDPPFRRRPKKTHCSRCLEPFEHAKSGLGHSGGHSVPSGLPGTDAQTGAVVRLTERCVWAELHSQEIDLANKRGPVAGACAPLGRN